MKIYETVKSNLKTGFYRLQDPKYLIFNEYGQLGPVFIFVMGIVLIGFYYVILSPMMYEFTIVHQDMQASGQWAIPSKKIESMIMLQYAWKAMVVIAPIILLVWLIMASLRENESWTQ